MALHRLQSLGSPRGQSLPHALRARCQEICTPKGPDALPLTSVLRADILLSDEHLPGEQVLRRSFFGINDVVSPNQVVATKASVLSITSANPATTELEPELHQSVNQVQIRKSSAVR